MADSYGKVLFVLALVLGGVCLGWFFISSALLSLPALVVSVPVSAIYLVVGTSVFRLSPMWPAAGWKWYVTTLVWGAGSTFIVVMIAGVPMMGLMTKLGWETLFASFGGAYPEEIAKTLGVILILFRFPALNRPWHGFVTGGLIGLGFEVMENTTYAATGAVIDSNSDIMGALTMWGARSVAGPGLHMVMSSLAGLGVGYAVFVANRSFAQRVRYLLTGFFAAFTMHFLWNILWDTQQMYQFLWWLGVACVLYPLFIFCWRWCHIAARTTGGPITMTTPITTLEQLPLLQPPRVVVADPASTDSMLSGAVPNTAVLNTAVPNTAVPNTAVPSSEHTHTDPDAPAPPSKQPPE